MHWQENLWKKNCTFFIRSDFMPGSRVPRTQILNARHSKNDTYSCRALKTQILNARHSKNDTYSCRALKTQILNARHSKNDTYSCPVLKTQILNARHSKNDTCSCRRPGTLEIFLAPAKLIQNARQFKKSSTKEHCKLWYGII